MDATEPEMQPVVLFDKENPASVLNLLPPVLVTTIEEAVFTHGHLFEKDEKTLKHELRSASQTPVAHDHRIRMKFWMEYDRAVGSGKKMMVINNVIAGVCSKEAFYKHYLNSPFRVAWMLCPPTSYMVKAEEGLNFGMDQLRDMLEIDHMPGGKFDAKIAAVKIKIVEMLENRVKGAIVQKTLQVNVGVPSTRTLEQASSDELMSRIKELDAKNRRAQNLPEPKPDIEVLPPEN